MYCIAQGRVRREGRWKGGSLQLQQSPGPDASDVGLDFVSVAPRVAIPSVYPFFIPNRIFLRLHWGFLWEMEGRKEGREEKGRWVVWSYLGP